MAGQTTVMQAGVDQTVNLRVGAGAQLSFDFDPYNSTMRRAGQDLVLTLHDAVELTLEGFFNNFTGDAANPFAAIKDFLFKGRKQIFLEN
jgi:hypothetical protein